jgi:DNA-binding response OmpR family regulator
LLTRNEPAEKVWGHTALPQSRTVDVHVASLRQKLERVPGHSAFIVTVHRASCATCC